MASGAAGRHSRAATALAALHLCLHLAQAASPRPEVSGSNQYAPLMQFKSGGGVAALRAPEAAPVETVEMVTAGSLAAPPAPKPDAGGDAAAAAGMLDEPLLAPTAASSSSAAADEELVISASEILADSSAGRRLEPPQPPPKAAAEANCSQPQVEEAAAEERWGEREDLERHQDRRQDRHPNSRLLLQILVLGLLVLVSSSLVLLYAIKFCVCRRRKRRLLQRRNLVADLGGQASAGGQDRRLHFECTCVGGLGAWTTGGDQQQQQLPSIGCWQMADSVTAAPHCAALCLGRGLDEPSPPPPPPPSYAELFGPAPGPAPAPAPAPESPAGSCLAQQRNLLVKLNLNKTKLLSADDLVLLSKLIDVPIVVQQQQQQQQQPLQPQQPQQQQQDEASEPEEEEEGRG